jgi:hypothetical protein
MFTSKLPFRICTIVIVLMLALGSVQPVFAQTPSNDSFASATAIGSLPYSTSVDLYYAGSESDEPYPYCGYGYAPNSVWFSFTPLTNVTVTAQSDNYYSVLAVYTGPALNSLTQRTCQYQNPQVTLQAEAGTTYYFQLSSLYPWYGGNYSFSIDVTPPPEVYIGYDPYAPSTFDTIYFYAQIYDPAGYWGTFAWNLGDGTTSNQDSVSHQYAKDGDYNVSVTFTTSDGRIGSSKATVQVRTRDVAITKVTVPQTAKSNTTKEITVEVTNRRYSDNVQVQLYKGLPGGGEQLIGTLTIYVPARANRATLFKFSYTFTGCDATVGKVTFRTAATLQSGRDALPADNTAIRTTLVSGAKGPCAPPSYP